MFFRVCTLSFQTRSIWELVAGVLLFFFSFLFLLNVAFTAAFCDFLDVLEIPRISCEFPRMGLSPTIKFDIVKTYS